VPNENPTFEISLAMAGAISAGAYSAGVCDFLFQALDEWYRLKAQHPDDYPNHDVVLTAISGASAGAITGALAVAALRFVQPQPATQVAYTLPVMFEAWVTNVDLRTRPGRSIPGLLSTGDLSADRPVTSLLNSDVLNTIGLTAFGKNDGAERRILPYVSKRLHVYLMISNLRGIPYQVPFQSNHLPEPGYGMVNHADRAHFIVTELGAADFFSRWDGQLSDPSDPHSPRDPLDPGVTLDVTNLGKDASGNLHSGWDVCLNAALASSAFPLGFSPRVVSLNYTDYAQRQWPFPHDVIPPFVPDFPEGYQGDTDQAPNIISFTCVDGGLCNNEPFEYAHYALLAPNTEHNPWDGDNASSAVIMIDPFPEMPDYYQRDLQKSDMLAVLQSMFFGLKDQARFKPSELAAALDDNWYSRYLIGPRRDETSPLFPGWPTPSDTPSENALGCGLLGGFGGFVAEAFRNHDYQLGRANCYAFLKDWFVLPATNKVVNSWSAKASANLNCLPADADKRHAGMRCIIPLLGVCATSPTPERLAWPQITDADVEAIMVDVTSRAEKMFPLFRAGLRGRFARWGAGVVWTAGVKSYLLNYARWAIKSDLINRDQYVGPDLGSVAARKVAAVLADPSYDYYTDAYISDKTNVHINIVGDILETLVAAKTAQSKALSNGGVARTGYTFTARAAGWWDAIRDWIAIGPPTLGDVETKVEQRLRSMPVPQPPRVPGAPPTAVAPRPTSA